MTSLTFKCPICGNQMKQIHFGKGRPNIKIEFDMGDGTAGTIIMLHLCSAMYVTTYSFLCLQRRQMSSPGYLRSTINSIDLHI
jgi:hypothetical protein